MNKATSPLVIVDQDEDNTLLVKSYARLLDGLRELATPDDIVVNSQGPVTMDDILDAAVIRIRKLFSLKAHAFLLPNDEFEFEVYTSQPESTRQSLRSAIDQWVDDGVFSWALNQNRAVVQHGEHNLDTHVLHVIATRSRVIGMFIGRIASDEVLDEGILSLLSVILMRCANGLESQELHAELREHNVNLEALVNLRTEELEIEKNRAEKTASEKSAFLATMSHEIRTPMNGVIGMAQLLEKSPLNDEQKSLVNTILHSGEALVHLINDILDFSKVEAGRIELDISSFSITQLIEDVRQLLTPQATTKGVPIEFSVNNEINKQVTGDAGRIRQVMLNLVGNAIKFTQQGAIKIAIDPCSDSERLHISVIDNGIGIKEEELSRLFNPFEQSDASIANKYGGTGLGLSICKQLIELMGGEIGVESEYGKGSTFWIEVALPASDVPDASSLYDAHNNDIEPVHLQGRALIADDNEINQKVIQLMLASYGIQTVVASNGEAALGLLETEQFDIVFMDCQMPVLNGYEVTEIIRNGEKPYQNTPVIALTANSMERDRQRCLAAGMDDFLTKPVNQNSLENILGKWLKADRNREVTSQTVASMNDQAEVSTTTELLDHTMVESLIALLQDDFADLRETFIINSNVKLNRLKQVLQSENLVETQEILHFLKGSCSSIAAIRLTSIIVELEAFAAQGSIRKIEELLPTLEHCYAATVDEVSRIQINRIE